MYGIRGKKLHEIYDLKTDGTIFLSTSEDKAFKRLEELDGQGEHDFKSANLDLSYIKSIGLDDWPDVAVKSVGRDEIQGYLALWGNPGRVDLDREYFTPETDFWDNVLPDIKTASRVLSWDHASDSETKADPVIGKIVDFGDDKVGRWYAAKLNRSHKYRAAIDKLISDGRVGTSSDSAPQYVLREKIGKSVWLKRWPLFAAALTEMPCEPRQLSTVGFKSLGIIIPGAEDNEAQYGSEAVQFMKFQQFDLEQWARRNDILK